MKTVEEMLAVLLGHLAEKFKNQLILKGGMLLRLVGSPRSTVDLDYCWIPTKSRKIMAREVKEAIEQIEGIKVGDIQLNSRGVILMIYDSNSHLSVNVEISVVKSLHLPPKPLSTINLSKIYSLTAQIIATMDLSEAFSHKIAATLERNLVRDIYDLNQMEPITSFDKATLNDRLLHLQIGRSASKKVSLQEAADMLKEKMARITEKKIKEELVRLLPKDHFPGLQLVLRACVSRVVQRMEIVANTPDGGR